MMSLQPTFEGFVKDTENALTLIQAVLDGLLQPVPRRPDESERDILIRSGAVFIIDEQTSGVQRWTDGVKWSPSRILGNFLLYRQLKETSSVSHISNDAGHSIDQSSLQNQSYPMSSQDSHIYQHGGHSNISPVVHCRPHNDESSLLGSLIDPGKYEEDSLMKKTISVPFRGTNYRLVSYYRPSDVLNGSLLEPMRSPALASVQISPELEEKKPFRGRVIEVPDPETMTSGTPYAYDSYDDHIQLQHYNSLKDGEVATSYTSGWNPAVNGSHVNLSSRQRSAMGDHIDPHNQPQLNVFGNYPPRHYPGSMNDYQLQSYQKHQKLMNGLNSPSQASHAPYGQPNFHSTLIRSQTHDSRHKSSTKLEHIKDRANDEDTAKIGVMQNIVPGQSPMYEYSQVQHPVCYSLHGYPEVPAQSSRANSLPQANSIEDLHAPQEELLDLRNNHGGNWAGY